MIVRRWALRFQISWDAHEEFDLSYVYYLAAGRFDFESGSATSVGVTTEPRSWAIPPMTQKNASSQYQNEVFKWAL